MPEVDTNIIFWIVLSTFTLGSAVLATVTVANVARLRNVRLSWKSGKMLGYPLFSTLFLIATALVGVISVYRGSLEEMIAAGLYGWLGCCWFTASFFVSKRFITDHGIVKNVNEPSQTVAWHQIRDFVEKKEGDKNHYIFIYGPKGTDRPQNLIRLELDVPDRKEKSFKKLISHKLGNRIRCYIKSDINVQEFD
ncbi:MAG: hypothetical protein PVH63_07390 [Balneolaceae bacterium]|jgi:hypothetical protein